MQLDLLTSTSSPADRHASHGLMPGSKEAQKMTAISGRKCSELSTLLNRDGLLAKMSEALLASPWASTEAYLTWKTLDTPANHLVFQLSARTPDTSDIDAGSSGVLPTPASRDYRFPNKTSYQERHNNTKGEQLPNHVGGPLNPMWVEWLMGYPTEWTVCGALETQSCPKSQCISPEQSLQPRPSDG